MVDRAQANLCDVAMVRIDAGFPSAKLLAGLEVLEHYRERGKAEGHMGKLKDVLSPALSSTNRPKSHGRRRAPQTSTPAIDAFACNEVRLLIALLAYEVMHIARRAMAQATGTGWSLRRLRERVLRAGAQLILSGRRMTLALSSAAAPFWALLWARITTQHWAGP
ncbi:MAG: transposase [Paracoccaceae bacterium]